MSASESIWVKRRVGLNIAGVGRARRGAAAPLRLNQGGGSILKRRYYYEQASVRKAMSNLIVSISVPDEGRAADKIRKWRKEGVNISAKVGMLIEEDQGEYIFSLKRKLQNIEKILHYNRANGCEALCQEQNLFLKREDWV